MRETRKCFSLLYPLLSGVFLIEYLGGGDTCGQRMRRGLARTRPQSNELERRLRAEQGGGRAVGKR